MVTVHSRVVSVIFGGVPVTPTDGMDWRNRVAEKLNFHPLNVHYQLSFCMCVFFFLHIKKNFAFFSFPIFT